MWSFDITMILKKSGTAHVDTVRMVLSARPMVTERLVEYYYSSIVFGPLSTDCSQFKKYDEIIIKEPRNDVSKLGDSAFREGERH